MFPAKGKFPPTCTNGLLPGELIFKFTQKFLFKFSDEKKLKILAVINNVQEPDLSEYKQELVNRVPSARITFLSQASQQEIIVIYVKELGIYYI